MFSPTLRKVIDALPSSWQECYRGVIRPSGFTGNPTCPRRYLYASRLRWNIKNYSSPKMVGSLMHRFFAGVYAGLESGKVIDALATALAPVFDAEDNDAKRKELVKNWNVARAMADHWIAENGHPNDANIEVLAIERTIQSHLDFIALPTTVVGTIDLAFRNLETKDVWLQDHKTCGYQPSVRAEGLAFDTQSRLYRWLWDATNPDDKAVGVVHNIIQTPTIRLKKNQSYEDYYKEIGEWYETEAVSKRGASPMLRSFVRFREPPLDESDELIAMLKDATNWCNTEPNLDTFYRNRHACVMYNKTCPYMELCNSNPTQWLELLTTGKYIKGAPPLEDALQGHGDFTSNIEKDAE